MIKIISIRIEDEASHKEVENKLIEFLKNNFTDFNWAISSKEGSTYSFVKEENDKNE